MIQAVIFDMDGVIFDTERKSAEILRQLGSEYGVTVPDELVYGMFSCPLPEIRSSIAKCFGEDFPTDGFFEERNRRYFAHMSRRPMPERPGLHALLDYLAQRNLPACVASSTDRETVLDLLESAGIASKFSHILGGNSVVHSKPAPDIYQQAAAQLGFEPKHCLAIEDSRNGVRSAFSAGCITVMVPDVTPPDEELQQKASYIVPSLDAVIDVLETLRDTEFEPLRMEEEPNWEELV